MRPNTAFTVQDLESAFQQLESHLPEGNWKASVLASDENEDGWLDGEAMLDRMGFSYSLVPPSFGGHWGQMDQLMDLYRALYRRDPCLGLGYAGSTFIACCNIWATGSQEQQQQVSDLLKANKKLACSYYETNHGNDLASVEFRADSDGESLVLRGRKEVTTNIERSAAMVVFARTSDRLGSRSHSQLLLIKDQLPEGAFSDLDRHNSVGMRGLRLGGVEFDGVTVPKAAILGEFGQALETTMRSFQVTRTLIPGMFLGVLDTALRLAIQFSQERRLHAKPLIEFENTRYVLSMVYLDALLIDCVCRLGARALQVLPDQGCLYAPAIKVIVPQILLGAMDSLATLMGGSFYRREGKFGLLQKLFRDVKPIGFAHVGRPACELTLLPLLHLMSRKSGSAEPLPSALTDLNAELAPLDFFKLRLSPCVTDPVLALLDSANNGLSDTISALLISMKTKLMDDLRAIHPSDIKATAAKMLYELSSTYASLLSASACVAWHDEGKGPVNRHLLQALVKRQLFHMKRLPRNSWSQQEFDMIFSKMRHDYLTNNSFDLVQYSLTAWEK